MYTPEEMPSLEDVKMPSEQFEEIPTPPPEQKQQAKEDEIKQKVAAARKKTSAAKVSIQDVYDAIGEVPRKDRDAFIATHRKGERMTQDEMMFVINNIHDLWADYAGAGMEEDEIDEPAASEGESASEPEDQYGERVQIVRDIKKYDPKVVFRAKAALGFATGENVYPPSVDGCQRLYEQVIIEADSERE
jgi:hypothetical protein